MKTRILILILICGVCISRVSGDVLTREGKGQFSSESIDYLVTASPSDVIVLNAAGTLSGQMRIRTGGENCQITYTKKLKTSSEADAKSYAELISIETTRLKDELTISLRAPAGAPWSGTEKSAQMDLTITIPSGCALKITTAYFDIDARGPFREFIVTESLSQVVLEDVTGTTEINVSNRPLQIKNIQGKLTAANKYGRIKLENIETGDQMATVVNDNGDILIDSFSGMLEISTGYGEIIADNLTLTGTKNRIKNISAPIRLNFDSLTSGRLRVYNHYGMISMSVDGPMDAGFICKIGEESTVTAEGMEMTPTLVYDDRLEFEVGSGEAEVRLTAKGDGNIIINGPQ